RRGQAFRDNGRFIGTFAEYFAKSKAEPVVSLNELMASLVIVRATCDNRLHLKASRPPADPFFHICQGVQANQRVEANWGAFLEVINEELGTTDNPFRIANPSSKSE